jgi:hypothetical protein
MKGENSMRKILGLEATVDMMTSAHYEDRFLAEYHQLATRIEKLSIMLSAWKEGTLNFQPECSYDLLEAQLNSMKVYLHFLQERAEIEGIEL